MATNPKRRHAPFWIQINRSVDSTDQLKFDQFKINRYKSFWISCCLDVPPFWIQPKRRHAKTATHPKQRHNNCFGCVAVLDVSPFWIQPKRRHTKTVTCTVLVVAVLDVSPFWLSPFWICRRFDLYPIILQADKHTLFQCYTCVRACVCTGWYMCVCVCTGWYMCVLDIRCVYWMVNVCTGWYMCVLDGTRCMCVYWMVHVCVYWISSIYMIFYYTTVLLHK